LTFEKSAAFEPLKVRRTHLTHKFSKRQLTTKYTIVMTVELTFENFVADECDAAQIFCRRLRRNFWKVYSRAIVLSTFSSEMPECVAASVLQ